LDWDLDLALEVLKSWLALMDSEGWIAREQILGPEARSKVPPEFQVQYPHYANPPTLFFIVIGFADRLLGKVPYSGTSSQYLEHPETGRKQLAEIYQLVKRHYTWFRRTQSGNSKHHISSGVVAGEGYRWRGRTPRLTLTSGLDDYPRAQPPHPEELHVDALSWVGYMAGVLKTVADQLGQNDDEVIFDDHYQAIKTNIGYLHWSDDEQAYCDATIANFQHAKVCHKGYITLLPFLTGLVDPHHPHLSAILDLIRDESELWSPYGLRSLSRSNSLYGSGENYWRSPIWVNINYLVIERLLEVAQTPGPHQLKGRKIYMELRRNIVSTVFESWRETGFAWEQYNPETGKGQRTQHFTGWTALVVKITACPDLEDSGTSEWRHSTVLSGVVVVAMVLVFRRKLMRLWRRFVS